MAIEYQNKYEGKAESTTLTLNAPTGFSAGDLFIACVCHNDISTYHPSGWTVIQDQVSGTAVQFSVLYRIAQTGDTNWDWTTDYTENWIGCILRYTGQAATGFIHASNNATGTSDAPTAPSVAYTSLETGSLTLQCFGADDSDIPYTIPSPLTERFYGIGNIYMNYQCGYAGGDKSVSGSDSTGTAAFTMNASEQWIAITVVIEAETTIIYETVSDTTESNFLANTEFILTQSTSGTHTPTLEGLSFGTTKALTESSNFSLIDPFTLLSTQSLTESSVFTQPSKLGITKSLSSSNTPTTELLFKLAEILSTTNNLSLDNPFTLTSIKTITESSNLSQIPITDYHKTQPFISSSNITTKTAWSLTESFILLGVPTTIAILTSALVTSAIVTGTPLSPTLSHTISKIITETSNLSIIGKFILEILLSGTYIPTSFDAYIDSASFSGSGTPSIADILSLHLIPSFQLTGIPTTPSKLTLPAKTFSMSGIVSVKDIFPLVISLSQTVTGVPALTFKFILSSSDTASILPDISFSKGTYEIIPFSSSATPTISKILDLVPTLSITIADNLSLTSDIILKLISSVVSGSFNVAPLNVASAITTMTGVLTKLTAWTTSQSLSQSDSFTIEDFTSYTKTIEKAATLTPTAIKVLNLFTTLSKTTSLDIATQFIQTLLATPTTTAAGTPSADLKFILEQVFTGQGVFSEISKFFITAILTNEMTNTVDAHFTLKDSFSISLEGIPLTSVLEVFIGKLSLVLSDSAVKELTLEDTTIKGLVLEDNPVGTLTLEDI